jgi:sn-glycerol 3-phosphate transport system ATP-binding protein
MAQVTLEGVGKKFDQVVAVRDVNLTVQDKEFVVLVGPSGCGKSTTLRMVAGLEEITAGTIRIGDRVVNDVPPKDRDIAMVFQNYALYPHMSVYDNMAFGLKLRKFPKPEIQQRVQEAAEILGIQELLQRKPRALSGGQRQRVAVGRAIVRKPQVFLFDEPLSNLDAKLRVQMRLEIQNLHRNLGTTSVYVTHDQVEAMTLAERMIVMSAGRTEQIGTPAEVYQRPATQFVAGFIGSPAMNFLRGRADASGLALADGGHLALSVPAALIGRELVLGIRPEHLEVCAPEAALFTLQTEMREILGADILVHGLFGKELLVARLSAMEHPAPAQALPLRALPGCLHWFDATSGARLESA